MNDFIRMESDWLNTSPVFYNKITKKISGKISDVIDWNNLDFDKDGLYNYLRFGYIVFEKTPIKNVERIPPNSTIFRYRNPEGKLEISINVNEDPVIDFLDRKSSPEECLYILKKSISNKINDEKAAGKKLLLPLSGGYDSRIIFSMIDEKSRIQAITYDVSLSEHFSSETINAKTICHKFNVKWQKVDVRQYWGKEIVDMNFAQFGPEMSLQPAYHIEMFERSKKIFGENYIAVSGSVGDWWSGEKLPLNKLTSWEQYVDLFHTIDIAIPLEYIEIKFDNSYNESCVRPSFDKIADSYIYRTVFSKRGRIGLASFINRVADNSFGSITPFYDLDVAMSQLTLPSAERKDRKWQRDYFSRIGLDIDRENHYNYSISYNNSLDLIAACLCNSEMDRLDPNLFDKIINKSRIDWINYHLDKISHLDIQKYIDVAKWTFNQENLTKKDERKNFGDYFDKICNHLVNNQETSKAINEWSVLLPIQLTLQAANK